MFDNLKVKLHRFMATRNGMDDLAKSTLIVSLILYAIYLFTQNEIVYVIAMAFLLYSSFRVFSSDIHARYAENQKYERQLRIIKLNFEFRKTYRFFYCKQCGKTLRVPKGKKKIEITCPFCGTKRIHRT